MRGRIGEIFKHMLTMNIKPINLKRLKFIKIFISLIIYLVPLPTKDFGFQIELAPIIGELNILRGSLGIRYRFRSTQADKLKE